MTKEKSVLMLDKDKVYFRWFKKLEKDNKITAKDRGKYLVRYCDTINKTPSELITHIENDQKAFEFQFEQFINDLQDKGKSREYSRKFIRAIKDWTKFNGISLKNDYIIKAKYLQLIDKDENYRRWYENLERGSIVTANERARVLVRFLNHFNLTPQGLIDNVTNNKMRFEDDLHDFITKLDKEGKSPGYQDNYLKSIRSWLKFNRIRLDREIKIRDPQDTPTLHDERVPNKQELKAILNRANERCKVAICLIAYAGIRPEVLGNSTGLGGLQIKHFPELEINGDSIDFTMSPTQIVVPKHLSKRKQKYITFLTNEGMDYLKNYLEGRIALGEKLGPESPIITVAPGYDRKGKSEMNYGSNFIITKSITNEIRRALRPRFKWRPYVFRNYCDTQLMLAESHGKILHEYRQHFMGHKGDIEAKYSINKNKLPPNILEDMRSKYSDCEEYLVTTEKTQQNMELLEKKIEKNILFDLEKANLNSEQFSELQDRLKSFVNNITTQKRIEREDVDEETVIDAELEFLKSEFVKRRMNFPNLNLTNINDNLNNTKHKILTENKLVKYLNEGWELVKEINGDKYLVKKD
jgi:hypothetical protein